MGSNIWILILGLAVIAVSTCSGRALVPAAFEADTSENDLSNKVEALTSNEPDQWVKVIVAPEPHVQHTLGTPLELECEILGTPPPLVKWIRGTYNQNEDNEIATNSVVEGSGGIARVRSRLYVDHVPSVGEQKYTCVGQIGAQTVHATTTVKTSSSEIYPAGNRHLLPADVLNQIRSSSPATNTNGPHIIKWFNVLLANIGSTVELPCEASAHQSPKVYWMDNNDNIITERDHRFKVMNDGRLVILSLKWDDMGEFHCVAKNDYGTESKGTFLYPMSKE